MRCSKKLFTECWPSSIITRTSVAPVLMTLAGDLYCTFFRLEPATRIPRARLAAGVFICARMHDPKELLSFSSRLLPGPKEREQPQNRDVDPDQRDHQPKRRVPLHEPRRARPRRPLDEIEVEREVERAQDDDQDAYTDAQRGGSIQEAEIHPEQREQPHHRIEQQQTARRRHDPRDKP